MDDLIPDMPDWFRQYLENLPSDQKVELLHWVDDSQDDSAVLDTLLEAAARTI